MKSHIASRIITICLLVVVAAAISVIAISAWRGSASPSSKTLTRSENLVVHEWGTFTSIAGKDGVALEWRPLNGASDLPKFVHTIQTVNDGLRHASPQGATDGGNPHGDAGTLFLLTERRRGLSQS